MTRDRVRRLLSEGLSPAEVARTLALSKSTVSYHARRLGIEPDPRFGRRYDWAAIRTYYEEGHTAMECQAHFGFDMSTWADTLRRTLCFARRSRRSTRTCGADDRCTEGP